MARVVVAAVDGEIGGRSGAPAEKEEEEEKKDVVLFVVHGQYPLVDPLTSERQGGLSPIRQGSLAGSRARGRLVDEAGKRQDGTVKHAPRSPLIDFRKGDAAPRAFPISRSRHANFRPHRSFVAA